MNFKDLLNLNNMALLGIFTYILRSIKGYAFNIYNSIMQRFRKSITITNQTLIERALIYIEKVCYNDVSKELLADNILFTSETNCSLTFGGYLIRIGKFTWISIVSSKTNDNDYGNNQLRVTLSVTFYGLNRRKYIDEFKTALTTDEEVANTLYMLSLGGGYRPNSSIKKYRKNKKIFGKASEDIINCIDRFIHNRELYDKYNKNYKLVMLLYGPPGTGKTSIVKHVAESLNLETIYFLEGLLSEGNSPAVIAGSINDDSVGNTDKNGKPCPALCVIEDIDKSILGVGDGDDKEKSRQVAQKGRTVDKLMQFLDSNISPNNIILIITTNNIELLPEPLIRSGRIDHKIYVGPLTRENAKEMCEHYGVNKEEILGDANEFNPADLENKIFTKIMGERNERVQS